MTWEVNAIVGLPGAGKTLLMVVFMKSLDDKNIRFMTNVETTFSNAVFVEDPLDMFELAESQNIRYAFFDELWVWLDSRFSQSSTNKVFTRFVNQIRKYDLILYHTLQDFYQIDKRVRKLTTYIILPYYDKERDVLYFNITNLSMTVDKVFRVPRASKYFGFYNTKQRYSLEPHTKRKK